MHVVNPMTIFPVKMSYLRNFVSYIFFSCKLHCFLCKVRVSILIEKTAWGVGEGEVYLMKKMEDMWEAREKMSCTKALSPFFFTNRMLYRLRLGQIPEGVLYFATLESKQQ